jgi:hypothetical protein
LTSLEEEQLAFFRQRGAIYLVVAAIAARLETFLGQKIPNIFHARFKKKNLSPEDGRKAWFSVVHAVAPLCNQLSDALADGLKNTTSVTAAIGKFKQLVQLLRAEMWLSTKNLLSLFNWKLNPSRKLASCLKSASSRM